MWHLTACKISVSLSVLNWIKNEMTFFLVDQMNENVFSVDQEMTRISF